MKIKINQYKIKVKVVSSPDEISKGMMNKKFNGDYLGMFFFLTPGKQSFWMKNCIIPLDIIFIGNDDTIVKIHHNCPPCDSDDCKHYTCDNADKCLELPGGLCQTWGIGEGDLVKYLQ
jgi:hypothetical protein